MYIDKVIKKEFLTLLVCVIVLIAFIIGFSYSFFFSVDEEESNIIKVGELDITFCSDNTCNNKYNNYGQIIGTKNIDGVNYPKSIYPYASDSEALANEPYIFNIKNTGSLDTYLSVKLNEDKDYTLDDDHSEYSSFSKLDYLKVGITNCNDSIDVSNVVIYKYNDLVDNTIINNEELKSEEEKTYCLWTWLDSTTPNEVQNTYFVANLSFDAEYKPKIEF